MAGKQRASVHAKATDNGQASFVLTEVNAWRRGAEKEESKKGRTGTRTEEHKEGRDREVEDDEDDDDEEEE